MLFLAMLVGWGVNPWTNKKYEFALNADTLEVSNEENIPILGTSFSAFEICGKIYSILKP